VAQAKKNTPKEPVQDRDQAVREALARIEPRHARELDRVVLPALPPVDCSASSVRLFRSLREADGVRYPTLARWRFQRPAPPSTLP